MTRRADIKDYHNLAQQRGFKWVAPQLPKNAKTKSRWQCSKGHQWQVPYQQIKRGNGCPECYKIRKRTPISEYHKLAESRGFKWLGKDCPQGIDALSLWECSKGHQWQGRFAGIRKGVGCPHCANVARKTEEDYHNAARKMNIQWLGPLPPNTRIKTTWQCNEGHTWETAYGVIADNHGCHKCAAKKRAKPRRKTPDDYNEIAKNNGIQWLGPEVKTSQTKTNWQCPEGHIWQAHYNSIQQNRGCPYCQNRIPKTADDYHNLASQAGIKWINKSFPQTVIHKTTWQCPQGHTWRAHYNSIQQGSNCPHCKISKGEIEISTILSELGISYEQQKLFDKCRGKRRRLPFDFMVVFPSHNGLIEYDGRQHFEPIKNWGGQKQLNQIQKHDAAKDEFAARCNIPLLRIAHNEDIATKLLDWLNLQLYATARA